MSASLDLLSGIATADAASIQRQAGITEPEISISTAILSVVGDEPYWLMPAQAV
jgi:hypothetical protein